jgi:hypothetical protein
MEQQAVYDLTEIDTSLGNFSPPTIGSRLLKERLWRPF